MANTTVIDITARVNDQTSTGVSSATRNISKLEQAISSMQAQVSRLKSGQITLSAFLKDNATTGLRSLSSVADKIAGKAVSITMKAIDYATAPIKALISLASNPITMLITATGVGFGINDIISTSASYEQSMANTRAVTGASDEDMALISAEARRLGASTAYSATEVGDASTILGTAGWSAESIVGSMEGLLNLASAGDVGVATAADITTSTIAQWGMDATDSNTATHVADVLAKTASSSKTDVSGLGETFKYAGSMASALEYSLEDTAIAVGLMGNAGIGGSSAGTSLRTTLSNLIDPTTDTADAMAKLGVSLSDENGEMLSLMDVMGDLRTGFSDLTSEEKAFYASAIAGTEGLSGLLAIVDASEEDFNTLTEALYGAEGAASEMAAIRMDTLQGDWAAFNSAVEDVKISIGERLTPMLRSLLQWMTAKMPLVSEMFQNAFEWADIKMEDISFKITALTETEEWEEADLFQKIKLGFDTLVGDPFGEWWDSSGRSAVTEIASSAGTLLGSVLSGGIITLLGGSVDATSEGMAIGMSFAQGFLDGFDVSGVASAIISGLGSIASEASKVLPGGEEATAASYLAAAGVGYAGIKVASGAATVADTGKSLWNLGATVLGGGTAAATTASTAVTTATTATTAATTTAATTATTAATAATTAATTAAATTSLGSKILTGLTSTASKVTAGLGIAVDGFVGATKAEEWTGSSSVGGTLISGVSGAVAGTGDGLFGDGSVLEKIIDLGTNTVKGAVVGASVGGGIGALAGGVAGLGLGAIGGENVAEFLSGSSGENSTGSFEEFSSANKSNMEDLTQIQSDIGTTISELDGTTEGVATTLMETLTEATASASEAISTQMTDFFEVALPESMSELWTGVEESLTEQGEMASEAMIEGITEFLGVTIPEFMTTLWETTGETLVEQGEVASEAISEGVLSFFGITLPEFMTALWDSTEEVLIENGEVASELINERIASFLGEMVPTSLDTLWTNTESTITETSLTTQETIRMGVTEFYGIFIPESIQKIWDSAKSTINSASATASASVNSSASSFFSSATSSINSFFSTAQSQINSAMASASSAISSLSVSTGSSSSSSATAYANGGILSSPHLGLVAEDGPEAIIPLSGKRRSRGIELWEQAGERLGVKPYADGGLVGHLSSNSTEPLVATAQISQNKKTTETNNSQPISVTIGNVSLSVNVDGGSDSKNLVEQIKENLGELTDEIASRIATSLGQVFENMPLATEI